MFHLSPNVTPNSTDNPKHNIFCLGMNEGLIVWTFFSAVNILFGMPACVALFWVQFKAHSRNGDPFTPSDVFMLNMAAMDLIMLLSIPPDMVNFLLAYNMTILNITLSTQSLGLAGRPLLMACSCLDCYVAVLHPLVYRARKSLVPRVVAASVVWIAVVVNSAMAVLYNTYQNQLFFVWPQLISLPVIAFCDFSILCALRKSGPAGRGPNPQKERAHQIIVNSLIMTAIAYLPTLLIPLLSLLPLTVDVILCQVTYPILVLPYCGSTLMSILYLDNLSKLDHLKAWLMTCLGKRA